MLMGGGCRIDHTPDSTNSTTSTGSARVHDFKSFRSFNILLSPRPTVHIDHRGAALGGSVHSCPWSGSRCDLSGPREATHRRARLRKLDANASVGSRSRSREGLNADQPGHEPNTPRHRATCVHVQSVLAPRRLSPREPMFVLGSPGADKYPCLPSVYQPRRPGALRSTRKPPVQGRCRTCRWERELG